MNTKMLSITSNRPNASGAPARALYDCNPATLARFIPESLFVEELERNLHTPNYLFGLDGESILELRKSNLVWWNLHFNRFCEDWAADLNCQCHDGYVMRLVTNLNGVTYTIEVVEL